MNSDIINTFKQFEQGYNNRDAETIDEFMRLFSDAPDSQMLGIGASEPSAYEWFTGKDEIKEIILSDWQYWGNVNFDIANIRITQMGGVAWFSLCASLEQLEVNEEAWAFYAKQMKELLEDKNSKAPDAIFEAAHLGIRRVRERNLGAGYQLKMVITGVLVKEETWKFHTLHWSMPVD